MRVSGDALVDQAIGAGHARGNGESHAGERRVDEHLRRRIERLELLAQCQAVAVREVVVDEGQIDVESPSLAECLLASGDSRDRDDAGLAAQGDDQPGQHGWVVVDY